MSAVQMRTTAMFPRLLDHPDRPAAIMPDGQLSYAQLDAAATSLAPRLPARALALWATPSRATVIALVAGLRAGTPLLPLNPKSGELELAHVLGDARPAAVLAGVDAELPDSLAATPRIDVDPGELAAGGAQRTAAAGAHGTAAPGAHGTAAPGAHGTAAAGAHGTAAPGAHGTAAMGGQDADGVTGQSVPPDDRPALILYTSGTTGMPKGVVHTVRSLAANLDALAEVWGLTSADRLVHALPLFHAHGLVLATIGPLRFGGSVEHVGAFEVEAVTHALADDHAPVLYAVPTMYHRLLAAGERDRRVADALRGARLLVSGSAALAVDVHRGIERLTGRAVVERYGMTETLIIASTRPGEPSRPGYVGTALPGVSVSVRDEHGEEVPRDDATIGSVWVRSPSLFAGYTGCEQTPAPLRDGWFHTGDLAALAGDGALRLVGRSSTDLIKSGGYRIAAGEIESVLLAHPAVEEVAVRGVPDAELGERVVAWVVPAGAPGAADGELIDYVAAQLTPHKRPREIRRVASLPRNELGKVQKQQLDGLL